MDQSSDAPGCGWVERRRALGAALRRARHPMALWEVAEIVGRPESSIVTWERGGAELGLDRVYALEELYGVRHGSTLEQAGYAEPGAMPWWLACATPAVATAPVEPPDPVDTFPRLATMAIETHGPLIETLAVLREEDAEAVVINGVLALGPLVSLHLGWTLWSDQVTADGRHPDEVMLHWLSRPALVRCRFALWGSPTTGNRHLRLLSE